MKRYIAVIALLISLTAVSSIYAYGPMNRTLGLGITVGEPTGASLKYWTSDETAINASVGRSYFGAPRVQADILWHMNAFNSNIASLYAGPGFALGVGNGTGFWYENDDRGFLSRASDDVGFGMRGVLGLNITPRNTPLELFMEGGLLVGFTPNSGTGLDAAVGMRFYP